MSTSLPEHVPKRRLTLPVAFAWIPPFIAAVHGLTAEELRARLGEPGRVFDGEGLGETDAWAFEYPRGMQLVYQFYRLVGDLVVVADSPEVRHAMRHMPISADRIVPLSGEALDSELTLLLEAQPERMQEVRDLAAFQVWRMDDNGNVFTVDEPTSERDAVCRVRQLQSLGHKQTYWYDRQ